MSVVRGLLTEDSEQLLTEDGIPLAWEAFGPLYAPVSTIAMLDIPLPPHPAGGPYRQKAGDILGAAGLFSGGQRVARAQISCYPAPIEQPE